jgi:hypothetical protein
MNTFDERGSLIDAINETHQELMRTLRGSGLDSNRSKQKLANIIAQEQEVISSLKAHRLGGEYTTAEHASHYEYNINNLDKWAALTLDEIYLRWAADRADMVNALEEMPEVQWSEPIRYPWGERGTISGLISEILNRSKHGIEELAYAGRSPEMRG